LAWHDDRPPWCKVHRGWWYSPSHASLSYPVLGVGLYLLWTANAYGRQEDGSGRVLDVDGTPLSDREIGKRARITQDFARKSIGNLLRVGTLFRAPDGCLVFPNLRKWQEDPAAARVRRYRERLADEGVTSNGQKPEARSQKRIEERHMSSSPSAPTPEVAPAEPAPVPAQVALLPLEPSPGPTDRYAADVERVLAHYAKHHPRSRPGKKERRLVGERLRAPERWAVEDLCRAIDGYHLDPFHQGQNDRKTPYLSLLLLLRDADHVQGGLELLDRHQRRRAARGGSPAPEVLPPNLGPDDILAERQRQADRARQIKEGLHRKPSLCRRRGRRIPEQLVFGLLIFERPGARQLALIESASTPAPAGLWRIR
jgi:hypothetical protein